MDEQRATLFERAWRVWFFLRSKKYFLFPSEIVYFTLHSSALHVLGFYLEFPEKRALCMGSGKSSGSVKIHARMPQNRTEGMKKNNLATFQSGDEKARKVQSMFDGIARRYDLMNRVMTFGQDILWRRIAIQRTDLPQGGKLLDIACGTGDLAFEALKRSPSLVVGGDFSLEMIKLGAEKRNGHAPLTFLAADGLHLPFRDNSFDAVTTGFSMRNVADVDQFLREMVRVVVPGGKVVILELTPLKTPVISSLFRFYFHHIVPLAGWLLTGNREAYTYLPQSVDVFISADELKEKMQTAGLDEVTYRKFSFGTVALHWGTVRRDAA